MPHNKNISSFLDAKLISSKTGKLTANYPPRTSSGWGGWRLNVSNT